MTVPCSQATRRLQDWMNEERTKMDQFLKDAEAEYSVLSKTQSRILANVQDFATESARLSEEINRAAAAKIPELQRQRILLRRQLDELIQPEGRRSLQLIQQGREHLTLAQQQLKEWDRLVKYFNEELLPNFRDCVSSVPNLLAQKDCSVKLRQCEESNQAFTDEVDRFRKKVVETERAYQNEKKLVQKLETDIAELQHDYEVVKRQENECKIKLRSVRPTTTEETELSCPALEDAQRQLLKEASTTLSKLQKSSDQVEGDRALEFIQESIEHASNQVAEQLKQGEKKAQEEEKKQYLLRQEIQDRLNEAIIPLLPELKTGLGEAEILAKLEQLVNQGVDTVLADLRDVLNPP